LTPLDPEFDFDLEFEWDSAKSVANLHKHGVDFRSARALFEDPIRYETLSLRPGIREIRRKVVGRIGEDVYAVICTNRGDAIRIISVRRARRSERRTYRESTATS
jgi:uncharacterized DUF497 family protein